MKLDPSAILDELDDLPTDGPTVGEVARQKRMDSLLEELLKALARPAQAPVVNVAPNPPAQVSMPELNIPAPQVVVQPAQRVLDWTFEFNRNPDGTIKSIRAKAT